MTNALTMAWIEAYRAVKEAARALKALGDIARAKAGIEGGGPWEAVPEASSGDSAAPNRMVPCSTATAGIVSPARLILLSLDYW